MRGQTKIGDIVCTHMGGQKNPGKVVDSEPGELGQTLYEVHHINGKVKKHYDRALRSFEKTVITMRELLERHEERLKKAKEIG